MLAAAGKGALQFVYYRLFVCAKGSYFVLMHTLGFPQGHPSSITLHELGTDFMLELYGVPVHTTLHPIFVRMQLFM